MITLAITSQKGGVGKTTLSINLAHAFARSGKKTLLVDADPQGSVGLSLTRKSRELTGFYDMANDVALTLDDVVIPTRMDTLSLVAAGRGSDYGLRPGNDGVAGHRVKAFLSEVRQAGYDYCLVDTAAGIFGATVDILAESDAVIIPQQAEPLGIRSVPKMLEALTRIRVANPRLDVLGVVLTMMNVNLAESREAAEALRSILPQELVFQNAIPRDDLFIRASAKGLPVGVMGEGEGAMALFDRLRLEIEVKLLRHGGGKV